MLGDTSLGESGYSSAGTAVFAARGFLNLAFNLFSSGVDVYGAISAACLGGFLAAGMLGAPALGRMGTDRRLAATIT